MRTLAIAVLILAAALPTFAETRAHLPVVGSTAGAFGSIFKTELQLNNRSAQRMTGRIVFHPQGKSGAPGDPAWHYTLDPHQTIHFDDVVAALQVSGLGSMDIIGDGKSVPTIIARAYDDKGEAGTAGSTVPAILPAEALTSGETGWLVVPRDRERYRFNVGVRTLGAGATASVTIYGANGIARKSISFTLPADYFVQQPADAFVSDVLLPNESLSFAVSSGDLIVYGTTTDNLTNDPSIQVAVAGE